MLYALYKKIYHLCDRLEDKVRGKLSHFPLAYAFIGGAGVIIFWRGIWHFNDYLVEAFFSANASGSISTYAGGLPWWDGPLSMLIGMVVLLLVGLFVSSFIGNEIIISGLKGEKKVTEKTIMEVEEEATELSALKREVREAINHLTNIEERLHIKDKEQK